MHILNEWSHDYWLWASLTIAVVWYALGTRRLYDRLDGGGPIGSGQVTAFAAGMTALFLVLVSPVDAVADQLFWVHMVQHLVLLLVAPPLLVLGRPALAFLWAFGPRGRKRVARLWNGLGLRQGIEGLMHPISVWLLFCGAFVVWHFPGPYQWAVGDELVHTLEHLSFFITGVMFWSLAIEPSGVRRLDYGPALVFIATAAILSGLPGALIALAPRPLYPIYAASDAAWGLTLLEDQQLAGVVMWIPGGLVYLFAAGYVFVKWLEQGERRRRFRWRQVLPILLLGGIASGLLGGCGKGDAQSAAERGAALIGSYGCGGCHTIPGISNVNGVVGPPLTDIGRRIYIAGLLRNTPDNMVTWLRDPQKIVPANVMPNMNISERDARDLTVYLYTLR
jgi:putative membrane protein